MFNNNNTVYSVSVYCVVCSVYCILNSAYMLYNVHQTFDLTCVFRLMWNRRTILLPKITDA